VIRVKTVLIAVGAALAGQGLASSFVLASGMQKIPALRPLTLPISLLDVMRASVDTKYRPQAPSDGVSRYPFYPKRELPK
jgi:hypothetical protein